jgi:hypothetical protein
MAARFFVCQFVSGGSFWPEQSRPACIGVARARFGECRIVNRNVVPSHELCGLAGVARRRRPA